MKIILISCSKNKLELRPGQKVYAKDLYVSNLFKLSYLFAQKEIDCNRADKIYILSAKYGLLDPFDRICTYNLTLKDMTVQKRKEWSSFVLNQMRKIGLNNNDQFIFLAGERYFEYLINNNNSQDLSEGIRHYHLPLKGMRIGERIRWLAGQ